MLVRENLEAVLGLTFPSPQDADRDDVSAECIICYSFRLLVGKLEFLFFVLVIYLSTAHHFFQVQCNKGSLQTVFVDESQLGAGDYCTYLLNIINKLFVISPGGLTSTGKCRLQHELNQRDSYHS